MSANHCAVENQRFQVWVLHTKLMECFPNAHLAPARKALVDRIPFAIRLWQQSPLRTTAGDPEHAFDKATTLRFIPNVDVGTGMQECQ